MNIIFYAFSYLFETLISYMYFNNKFYQKSSKITLSLALLFSFLIQYSVSFIGIPYFNLATFIICNSLVCLTCYDTKLLSSLFNALILTSTMLITELIIMYITRLLFGFEVTDHLSNNMVLFVQLSSSKILFFITTYLISKLSTKENHNSFKFAKSFFLLILPLASIVLLIGIVRITELYNTQDFVYYIFVVSTILLMYSNVIVFWVYESTIKAQKELTELKLQKQKSEIDTEYYTLLQTQYENSNILIHDIKRHLLSIGDLANDDNSIRIKEYINTLYAEYQIPRIKQYSSNNLINAIVNRYATMCTESSLDLFCDIRDINFSFMPDSHITAILDNLLENAVEAAKSSEKKFIDLIIELYNNNFVKIVVRNSCADAPKIKHGELQTTKANKEYHGFGIKSIKRILVNYDGSIKFDFDAETQQFSTVVILKTI